ncbi:MAG: hypothetical protein IJ583_11030 [Firmicutes bacterium]|nr:hypothetical protein [Bacillota bacterium]
MTNKNLMLPTDSLADINEFNVDNELSKKERIKEFIRQIKDPYRFKCGDIIVESRYSANGLFYEDCLQNIFKNIS